MAYTYTMYLDHIYPPLYYLGLNKSFNKIL